jgi:hypothetical protein
MHDLPEMLIPELMLCQQEQYILRHIQAHHLRCYNY